MQVPTKQDKTSPVPNQLAPCLEATLKSHRIWTFSEVWLHFSRELDINTLLGIHFLQD